MKISNKKIEDFYKKSDIEGLRIYLLSKGMPEKKVLDYIMALYVDNIPSKYFYIKEPVIKKKTTVYFLVVALVIFILLHVLGSINDVQLFFGLSSSISLMYIQKKYKNFYK